jgi:hypothetical protein
MVMTGTSLYRGEPLGVLVGKGCEPSICFGDKPYILRERRGGAIVNE